VTTVRDGLPGPRVWAIFRRQVQPTPELKFYLSNAPATCSRAELVRVCGLRWPVETTLEEGKDELGMDHYETRSWVSWHHHMAQTFMAHLFLMRVRLLFKKSPVLTTAQARQLIARALADELVESPDILATLAYRQQRNYAAYCSHRRQTLKRKT